MPVDEAGRLVLVPGVRYLNCQDVVFAGMLEGGRNQQLSRNLSFGTIEKHVELISRFADYANEYPWQWSPANVRSVARSCNAFSIMLIVRWIGLQRAVARLAGGLPRCDPLQGRLRLEASRKEVRHLQARDFYRNPKAP